MKCCCESQLTKIENTHYRHYPVEVMLLSDSEGYGIIILDRNEAIACFEINYCPICGKKLEV